MYKENKLDALTPEKVEKIKKFAKPYIQKVLHKLKKRSKKRPGSKDEESATPTTESPTVQLADEVGDLNMDTLDDMDMDVDDASDEDSAKNGHDNETPAEVDPATPVSPDALPESNADPRLRTADPRRPSQELTKPMSVGPS
jgi:histone-lysine N-methyltransferase SETD2